MEMNAKQQRIWFFVAVIFALGIVYYMLTPLFEYPGRIALHIGGDAAKNYYTYLYHTLYGSGTWFTGMNYPYGEHIVYTDAQPLLSVTLSYLRSVVPIDKGVALGILHVSVIVSYIAAIIFSYQILRYFKVKPWLAILFAPMIIVMSPQTYRISGHFALCHAVYIPMLIYWLLRFNELRKLRYLIYMFISTVVFSFMHPYYIALCLIFCGFYCLGYMLFVRMKFITKLKQTAGIMTVPLLSAILLKAFMALTDPMTERPVIPQGTMFTLTEGADIFSAFYSPVSQLAKENDWFKVVENVREGAVYPGISVLLIIIVAVLILLAGIFIKNKKATPSLPNENAALWLTVATGTLLLGMGVPFIWDMEWLFDKMSLFRQFRSLGRFSTITYYIVAFFAAIALYRAYASLLLKGRRVLSYTVLCLPLCLWMVEATASIENVKMNDPEEPKKNYDFFFSTKEHDWASYLQDFGYKPTDFQSLLILPYTHVGSEKLWVNPFETWNMVLAYKASLQLHLPINDVFMSRSDWSQTKKQVRIEAGPWGDKAVLYDLKSTKPFLLLAYDDLPLNPDQRYLLKGADSLGHFSQSYVFVCYPERIKANDRAEYDKIKSLASLNVLNDTCVAGTARNFYVDHFDQFPSGYVFIGNGALPELRSVDTSVAEIPISSVEENDLYEFSCWVLPDTIGYKSPHFTLDKLDSAGTVISWEVVVTSRSVDNAGQWYRISNYITLPLNCKKLRAKFQRGEENSYIAIDELMLRNADATVLYKSPKGKLMINNHLYNTDRIK